MGTYLRVGLHGPAAWRTFKLRQDFAAASKVQTEDDISASVVVPAAQLAHDGAGGGRNQPASSSINCEYRLFQRPDDAMHRGLDKQTEADLARRGQFHLQFRAADVRQTARAMVEKVTEFEEFTPPMRQTDQRSRGGG